MCKKLVKKEKHKQLILAEWKVSVIRLLEEITTKLTNKERTIRSSTATLENDKVKRYLGSFHYKFVIMTIY